METSSTRSRGMISKKKRRVKERMAEGRTYFHNFVYNPGVSVVDFTPEVYDQISTPEIAP